MNFTEWLKNEEGFISRSYFESLLDNLPLDGKRKVKAYYREKYRYYMMTHPEETNEQMEWNIN